MLLVLMFLRVAMSFLMNIISLLLSLTIVLFLILIYFSMMEIAIVRGAWSDISLYLGWIEWLSNSVELLQRNMRLIIEFNSWQLSKYLVVIWSIEWESSKLKTLAKIKRLLLMWEWWEKRESHELLQILKSPVIIKTLWMLTSVSLRYFKAEYEESE